jgi:signal transduction histidine kinase/HAMP domain-containing protein
MAGKTGVGRGEPAAALSALRLRAARPLRLPVFRSTTLRPTSLRARLTVALVGVALPLVMAVALLAARQLQTARTQVLEQQQALAVALAQVVADYVGLHRAAVGGLAAQSGLAELAPEAQQALLVAVGDAYPEFVALGVLDPDGRPVAGLVQGAADSAGALPARSLYEAHRDTEQATMVTTSPYSRRPMIALGVPLRGVAAGGRGGLVAGGIESARLDALLERTGGGLGGAAYLVDEGGRVLSRPQGRTEAPFTDRSRDPPVATLLARGGTGALRYQVGNDARLAGYAHVPGLEWGVVVDAPESTALMTAREATALSFEVLALATAAAALVGVALARSLTRPLGALVRAVEGIAAGRPAAAAPLPSSGIAEVARLTAAFADMRDRLTAQAADRERAEQARVALIREHAAREAALERSARLRALHEAALTIAGPEPLDREALAALLATATRNAVAAVSGLDGALVLAEDAAWRVLAPERDPEAGPLRLDRRGRITRGRLRSGGATAYVLASGEFVSVPDTLRPFEAVRGPVTPAAAAPAAPATGEVLQPSRFGTHPQHAARGVRAFAVAPLNIGGRVIGALTVNFAAPGPLHEGDREVLELLAAHAAAALERARLAAERRAAQRDLAAREVEATALRELDRLKNEFLSTISHELRTPLTVVDGYAQLLASRGQELAPAAVEAQARRILSASSQLTHLVQDLLDFARLEHGEIAVNPRDGDLAPVLQETLADLRRRPGGERLEADLPPHLLAHADPLRVAQVVSNLLDNALKYAPEGPVRLSGRAVADGALPGAVRVEVVDQGPGVPPAEQGRVWEKFFRGAGVAELHVARGSGIGLAVVKALVEAQRGRVGLESVPGQGARFWIELPAAGAA